MTRRQHYDGSGWVNQIPRPSVPTPPPTSGGRNIILEPYVSTSPLVLPLPVDVAFESATSGATVTLSAETTTGNGGFWVNQQQYSHTIIQASETDPLVAVTDRNDSSRSFGTTAGVRIPTDAVAASGTDGHLCVMQPGSTFAVEFISMRKVSDTSWSCSRNAFVDYAGNGLGPRDSRQIFTNGLLPSRAGNGCRATGFSQMSGLIRKHEVDRMIAWAENYRAGLNPSPVGVIPHPLGIGLRANQLKFEASGTNLYGYYQTGSTTAAEQIGWPVGMPRAGFMYNITRHPGSEFDFDGANSYTGQNSTTPGTGVPMSTIVGIPAETNLYTGSLTPYDILIGQALKDYGGIVMDRSGDGVLYIEIGSSVAVRDELLNAGATGLNYQARPVRRLFSMMRIVTGHTHDRPGGQPLSAPRRRPLAPPLAL